MRMVVGGVVALLCAACATTGLTPSLPPTPTAPFVSWSHRGRPEKRVCVLPFADRTGTAGLALHVRQSFAGQLSVKRFHDAELSEIDAQLAALAADWRTQPAQQVGKLLGCDALIYGEVTRAGRWYLSVYSRVFLEGTIRMVDATSGQTLVQHTYTTRFHGGGIPFSPLGVLTSSVLNLRHMGETELVKVVDDLGRHLAAAVPDLPTPGPQTSSQPPLPATPAEHQAPLSDPVVAPPHYRIQVVTCRSSDEARHVARLLRDKGYRPAIAEVHEDGQSRHRVVLGPFASFQEAARVRAELQHTVDFSPIVTRVTARQP
ncbi:MAG: SPOR domain-containing protein [Candidatus Binatia bacterium]|nr:SPOR domain-containing protein [Candidatus Binatia bacterium]